MSPRLRVQLASCVFERHNREEVRKMNYTKPEITVVENALAAVQFTGKVNLQCDSIPHSTEPSSACYESDE